jgi:hypothetical protein
VPWRAYSSQYIVRMYGDFAIFRVANPLKYASKTASRKKVRDCQP